MNAIQNANDLDPTALKAMITAAVADALARTDRLAYTEEEAAALLGLRRHQLRDERLRGLITASTIMGRKVRYLRQDLTDYMLSRRTDA